MQQTQLACHEADILMRLVGPDKPALSAAAAKGILRLTFSPADKERMHHLATKARAGNLSDNEQAQIEAYSRVSSLLGIMKSMARRTLKCRVNGKIKTP
jgi:cytochrome c553